MRKSYEDMSWRILLASPSLSDSVFEESVVLVLEDGPEGSLGLILNKPNRSTLGELSEDFDRVILDLSPGLGRLERSALIASDEIITPMTPEVFSLDGLEIFIDELQRLKKNMRSQVKHTRIIINSYDERIRQHRDIYSAAEASGRFHVYRIPVDPLFRKAQEASKAPQLYKVRGRGLKAATVEAIQQLDRDIWM